VPHIPRSADRGHIEAPLRAYPCACQSRAFRDQLIAATLKLGNNHPRAKGPRAIPRSADRGHIEAVKAAAIVTKSFAFRDQLIAATLKRIKRRASGKR